MQQVTHEACALLLGEEKKIEGREDAFDATTLSLLSVARAGES